MKTRSNNAKRFSARATKVEPRASVDTGELWIYDEVHQWFGVTARDVKNFLEQQSGAVSVYINSPGGNVFEGLAIYQLLKKYPGTVKVRIDALAASIASVIALAGNEIEIAPHGLFMIHDPWTFADGSADEFRAIADRLDKAKGSISSVYQTKATLSADEISAAMSEETWYDATEALDAGFVTTIDEEPGEAALLESALDSPWFVKTPVVEGVAPRGDQAKRRRVFEARQRKLLTNRENP